MRTLRLARIAAEAEGLRLRQRIERTATRVAFGLVAMGFLACTVVFLHIAAWFWLRSYWMREYTALAIAGADFVLALILAALASRSTPGRVELEALAVRERAWESAVSTIAFSTLALQLLGLLRNLISRSRSRS